MAEVAPEDVAEVQAHANALIMQAHTTIREEIPAGSIQHSFLFFIENVTNQLMQQFAYYGRLTKEKIIEMYDSTKAAFVNHEWRKILDAVFQGGTGVSSVYMGPTIISWLVKPSGLIGFLGAGELFADTIAGGGAALFSLEGAVFVIMVVLIIAAVLLIIGHVTNNLQETYYFFIDGDKETPGYFRKWHEELFGNILGDNIYNISDLIMSWRGLMAIKYLEPERLVESCGLTIQRLLNETERAWRSLSKSAFTAELLADAGTIEKYFEKGISYVEEHFPWSDDKEKSHE